MVRAVCLLFAAACLALAGAGCGGSESKEARPQPSELIDLTDIEQLKTAFNDGQDRPRLIMLLSPT